MSKSVVIFQNSKIPIILNLNCIKIVSSQYFMEVKNNFHSVLIKNKFIALYIS